MGITIHFEGKLKNRQLLPVVLQLARRFANDHSWPFTEIPEKVRTLMRVWNETDWDYTGSTSGIEIYPHEACDPFRLEFDGDCYIQEYVKTQFAPIQIHIDLIDLLERLRSTFLSLEVVDESDFWEIRNVTSLEAHFSRFFEVMNEEKKKNPRLSGPSRLNNGRIADLLED